MGGLFGRLAGEERRDETGLCRPGAGATISEESVFALEAVEGGGEAGEDLGELQPVLAAALAFGELPKLGDDRVASLVEGGELFVRLKLAAGLGSRGGAAELGDGGGEAGGVFRDEFDDFAVEMERATADGGDQGAVEVRGDAGELGEFEVGRAKLVPEADDLVRVSAVDSEVAGTEIAPAGGYASELAGLAQAMETSGLSGGAAAGDEAERPGLPECGAEVQRAGNRGFMGRAKHVTCYKGGQIRPAGSELTD